MNGWCGRVSREAFRHRSAQVAGAAFLLVLGRVIVPSVWLTFVWCLSSWADWSA